MYKKTNRETGLTFFQYQVQEYKKYLALQQEQKEKEREQKRKEYYRKRRNDPIQVIKMNNYASESYYKKAYRLVELEIENEELKEYIAYLEKFIDTQKIEDYKDKPITVGS